MEYILKNAKVYDNGALNTADVLVRNGHIAAIGREVQSAPGASSICLNDCVIFPGFVDVHVHLREPGFSYKETVKTGTLAAARGGYAHVCPMPNLNPVPDSREHLAEQLRLIEQDACIHVHPFGSITVGEMGEEMADLEGMAADVAGFSDDGKGVQSEEMMREAMVRAKALNKIISAHCEDNTLLHGGYIHDGEYARLHGHRGICSESEWGPIARDLKLVEEIGCKYHVCHISTKESVALIREAKKRGVDVTCEVGPHYLVFNDMDLQEDARFKMNPPIRSEEDRKALIEGIADGTIDMIATDHAPHSAEEKGKGLEKSAMGVVGLETAFAVCYTHLVKTGIITLERLVELLHDAPMRRFGYGTNLAEGETADLTAFDLEKSFTVDPADFQSMGKASPFTGMQLQGVCKLTMVGGEIVWQEEQA
ncbi:MAG: dihydroorotase [Oscillospiraceae bacterium]|nr:dihydroorotase [Oscillospiraceae bacterium]